jgi:hypothetical protein
MKLRVYIAGKFKKNDIPGIKATNPSYDELDATKHFVEDKYVTWIDANMVEAQDEYLIEIDTCDYFDIDFTHREHAETFRTSIGGAYL